MAHSSALLLDDACLQQAKQAEADVGQAVVRDMSRLNERGDCATDSWAVPALIT